jgi:hypothetical protein
LVGYEKNKKLTVVVLFLFLIGSSNLHMYLCLGQFPVTNPLFLYFD